MINKIIAPTLKNIDNVNTSRSLTLEVDHYLLNGYAVDIEKVEDGFTVIINFKLFSGFSSAQLHSIELPPPIILRNADITFYLPENSLHLNQKYYGFETEEPSMRIHGTMNQLSTSRSNTDFDNKCLRLIIPILKHAVLLPKIRTAS